MFGVILGSKLCAGSGWGASSWQAPLRVLLCRSNESNPCFPVCLGLPGEPHRGCHSPLTPPTPSTSSNLNLPTRKTSLPHSPNSVQPQSQTRLRCLPTIPLIVTIIPSQMEVAPLHCSVDITQKRRLFQNTKETEKM